MRTILERQCRIDGAITALRALGTGISPKQVAGIHAAFGVDSLPVLDGVRDLIIDPEPAEDDERLLADTNVGDN